MENKDTIYTLVAFAKNLKYEDIPKEDILGAKMLMMDVLGVSIAGTTADGVREARELLLDWGGKKEARTLIFDDQLPVYHAGFINSVLAHARDFDEVQADAVVHTGISVIPTVMTVADAIGGVDGRKLITTIVAAVDVFVRMGRAVSVSGTESGWIYSALIGHLITPLAAGLLMDLSVDEIVNAIGICYSQTGGNQQAARDTSLTKRMQPAYAARSGIFSAYMAKAGITGAVNIIDGKYGFYHNYIHNQCDKSKLTEDLGKVFWIHTLSYKPYPVCGQCLSPSTDVDYLMKQHQLTKEDIISVDVGTNQHGYRACVEPEEVKFNPQRVVDGQFSIPFSVATMIVKRHLTLSDLTDEGIHDAEVRTWFDKIHPYVDEDVQREYPRGICPAKVTLHTTKGDFTAAMFQKGHPTNPFTMEDMEEKFRFCIPFSIYPMKDGGADEIISQIENLEQIAEFREFVTMFNNAFIR